MKTKFDSLIDIKLKWQDNEAEIKYLKKQIESLEYENERLEIAFNVLAKDKGVYYE